MICIMVLLDVHIFLTHTSIYLKIAQHLWSRNLIRKINFTIICMYDIFSIKPAVYPKTVHILANKKLVLGNVEELIFFIKTFSIFTYAIFRNFELLQME